MSESVAHDETSAADESTVIHVSRDELLQLLDDSAHATAGYTSDALGPAITSQIDALSADVESLGTVSLVPEQYDGLTALGATGLHAEVVMVGLLSLLLGAVIATAMTLHWRGRG